MAAISETATRATTTVPTTTVPATPATLTTSMGVGGVAESPERTYAYLGPQGTYSHQAALAFTAAEPDADVVLMECASISDIFDLVDRGRVAYGVVPIENALEGSVNETLDAFAFISGAQILGETIVDIHHNLIVRPGSTLADIQTVISHPQALGQCRRWLSEHLRGARTQPANSTSEGVRQAVTEGHTMSASAVVPTGGTTAVPVGGTAAAPIGGTAAAIGTVLAAELFGGEVIASQIEDHYGNQTRFVLIGTTSSLPAVSRTESSAYSSTEAPIYKTSLALFMKEDCPGTLLMILEEFAYAGVNLTKIQSRPTKRALGDYMFWIDIEAHTDDPHVRTALDCLRLKLREVKSLGSYPKG